MYHLLDILLIIWLLNSTVVFSNPNPNITNGTCYYAPGKEAPSRFIPCGNDAVGRQSCCESLDMCLSNGACYNGQYGVTYLAGCSDPEYEDSSCPNKDAYNGNIWSGLVYCNGSSSDWVACPDTGSTVKSPEFCYCPSTSRTIAFSGPAVLSSSMSLPASPGASVTWMACNGPYDCGGTASETTTSTTSSSTSSSSSSNSSSTASKVSVWTSTQTTSLAVPGSTGTQLSTPTRTSTPTASPTPTIGESQSSPGLSKGAKIGVGVGAGIGGAGAIALVAAVCFQRSRKKRKNNEIIPPVEDQIRKRSPVTSPVTSEIDSTAARPWSLRSELPAQQPTQPPPAYVRPTYQSMDEGTSATISSMTQKASNSSPGRDFGNEEVHEMPG